MICLAFAQGIGMRLPGDVTSGFQAELGISVSRQPHIKGRLFQRVA